MSRPLNADRLDAENRYFAGTRGVSAEAARLRLVPAFQDTRTGRVEIARFPDGRPAPVHLLHGLPEEWALAHDEDGTIKVLKAEIICGFVRGADFYTRQEAAAL
ncbi:MAG: hypothetical protein V2I63_02030 [Pseudomonadales bacterium]|jgi:hypothetical protein|nr:hypothetical protein [Pseudomonadales bacterium]